MSANIADLKRTIATLLKKYHVVRAGLFGSYARGEQKKNSDIDILVDFNDDSLSLIDFIRIKHALEDTLGRNVDLVEYKAIHARLRKAILKEEIKIL